jgi:hypothetical protein
MTIREQRLIFTLPILWMFAGFLWATVACPPPRADETHLVFAFGVASTLIPAFAFYGFALWASRREV